MKPILSICIPTFNRACNLKRSLDAYVNCSSFNDEVEIIISDNASTDETQVIGEDYSSRYSNIKYFRNETNVKDSNFCLALDRATGVYVKLQNDNSLFLDSGVEYLKRKVKKYQKEKPVLFFINNFGCNKELDEINCNTFEEYFVNISYNVTAILNFGAWKEDWKMVTDRLKYTELQLNQDDWSYQIVNNKGKAIICTDKYCDYCEVGIRKGYNWFEVHVANYYKIVKPYIDRGLISESALKEEKRRYLKWLKPYIVNVYLYNIFPDWKFDYSGTFKILVCYFGSDLFFYRYILTFPIWGSLLSLKCIMLRLIKKLKRRY